jgi:hypothetical protein
LSQIDEDEDGGLRALAQVFLSYGERHFDGAAKQQGSRRGVWAGVLLMCGQFERVRDSALSFVTEFMCYFGRPWRLCGNIKTRKWKLYILLSRLHTMVYFVSRRVRRRPI